jgi:hypothetical protein
MYGITKTPLDLEESLYDSDTLDYFNRAEAEGGTFDRTSINATYTEEYVKAAIDDFVRGLKEDGIWDKLTEVYLLCGVSYAGILAKLKYTTTPKLTNSSFVTGDYLSVGSGLGLKGNGSTKKLDTGKLASDYDPYNTHLMAALTEAPTNGVNACHIGASVSAGLLLLGRANSGAHDSTDFASSLNRATVAVAARNGIYVGNSSAQNSRILYRNGSSIATSSSSITTSLATVNNVTLFAATEQLFSNARQALNSIGDSFTPTEVSNYITRINTLTTALGNAIF